MDIINITGLLNGRSILHIAFLVVVLFSAGASIVIFYHWKRYGMGGAKLALIETIYLTVAVILLSIGFFNLPK